MKKIALYPFNKITQGLIRNQELMENYEIKSVIDFAFYIGKDTGEEILKNKNDIKVTDDIEDGLEKVELLLLNDGGSPFPATEEIMKIYEENRIIEKWKQLIIRAVEKNIKIVIVAGITDIKLLEWMELNKIKTLVPLKNNSQILEKIAKYEEFDVPKIATRIAIFGTKPCIGKHTVQMELLKILKKNNEQVVTFITEPTSFLYNQPQICNLEADYNLTNNYINALIKEHDIAEYNYMIMADQGGVNNFMDKDLDFIYKKIMWIKVFRPDKVILVADYENLAEIEKAISNIKTFCAKAEIVAVLLPDRVEIEYGKYQWKSNEDFLKMKERIIEKYDVKVIEKISRIEKVIEVL